MKSLSHHFFFGKSARRPDRGQGLVEFALVLPLLLLLLVGVVELGRMLVIYSSVNAASREAARYGAAAGVGPNGVEYYLDETGMRDQAQRVAVLSEITMDAPTYDSGPGTSPKTVNEAEDVALGDRVNITVHARYEPILRLAPLWGFDIDSRTSRTILKEVSIVPFGNGGNENGNENEENTPPIVTITSPARNPIPVFSASATITFVATVTDAEQSGLEGSITWTSSIDGNLDTGGTISASNLTPGDHEITASVTDSGGLSGSDHITIRIDPVPVVYILTPSNAEVEEGTQLSFTAQVVDNETGLEAAVVWTDDGAGFGTGSPVLYTPTGVRLHTIRACVTDSAGGTGCATLLLPIAAPTPPDLVITSPANNASYAYGASVVFAGTAVDSHDGDLSSQIVWTSSIDGALGTGASLSTNRLHAGTHTITARVTDSGGLSDTATITVVIVDSAAPVVTISLPLAGAVFNEGDVITFQGSASDTVDGNLTGSLRWSSSRDGSIGAGGSFTRSTLTADPTLDRTPHTIRAEVTDSNGLVGYAVVVIYIRHFNSAPVVTITQPGEVPSPTIVLRGRSVTFTATANDAQEGDLSADLVWSSSRDGQLHIGSTFSTSTLTSGLHVITASVTDEGGLTGSDTVQVRVDDFNCPIPGAANFIQVSNNQYGGFNWNITLPSNSSTSVQYIMKTLVLTMESNPANAVVSTIAIDGVGPIDYLSSGTVVRAPRLTGGTVWTGYFGSSGINVTYTFAGRFNRNQGGGSSFRVSAEFVGCPTAIQAIGTLN